MLKFYCARKKVLPQYIWTHKKKVSSIVLSVVTIYVHLFVVSVVMSGFDLWWTQLILLACLCKTNQEKLLTKATPLHSLVCPSTIVTAWIGVKRPITTAPGFQASTMSWWSKSLKFSLLSSFHPAFTSLSATTQGFFDRSKPSLMQNRWAIGVENSTAHARKSCYNIFEQIG